MKVIKNSLITDRVNVLRDLRTPRESLRGVVSDLGFLLLYEALKEAPLTLREIETWIGKRNFEFLYQRIVLVPVLRAGLAMFEGARRLLPNSPVGFLMATRNEESLEVEVNCEKVPDLSTSRVIILDPMLATGNTLISVLKRVRERGPEITDSLHILATEKGIERVESIFPDHRIWVAVIDEDLSHKGYILPGLGDIGDRLYS